MLRHVIILFCAFHLQRYTPPLIGMLCMTVCLEMMGTGPLFHHDLLWSQVEHCYDDWMSHLFYYSNYKDIDKTVREPKMCKNRVLILDITHTVWHSNLVYLGGNATAPDRVHLSGCLCSQSPARILDCRLLCRTGNGAHRHNGRYRSGHYSPGACHHVHSVFVSECVLAFYMY